MAIVVLLPFTVIGAIWAIRRGAAPMWAWGVAAALHAILALSAWASLASGDPAKDKVEQVIAEAPIESHEEAAEAFLALAVAATVISLAGLRKDRAGQAARAVAAVGTVALLGAGWKVGHSGGQLVYRYNAGAVYANTNAVGSADGTVRNAGGDHDDTR